MDFFGCTLFGPQNYIKDITRAEYQEPMKQEHVIPLMAKVETYATMSKKVLHSERLYNKCIKLRSLSKGLSRNLGYKAISGGMNPPAHQNSDRLLACHLPNRPEFSVLRLLVRRLNIPRVDYVGLNLVTCHSEPLIPGYILSSQRPDINKIIMIDCYLGRVNGFAYGSFQRYEKIKRKGVIKPTGPGDIYRMPPTTSVEYGWWHNDPELIGATWHYTSPRYPQPSSPNTLILDIVRKNNKYATLY